MIQACATNETGRRLLILGFNKEALRNIEHEPRYFHLAEYNGRRDFDDVIVLTGQSDEEIAAEIKKNFGDGW